MNCFNDEECAFCIRNVLHQRRKRENVGITTEYNLGDEKMEIYSFTVRNFPNLSSSSFIKSQQTSHQNVFQKRKTNKQISHKEYT